MLQIINLSFLQTS